MKKYLWILLFIFLLPIKVLANDNVNIYVFHREDCKHCHNAISYLKELEETRKDITVLTYEISKDVNAYNRNLFNKATDSLNIKVLTVPFVVIGNNYYIGFDETYKENYVNTINFYKRNNYRDTVGIAIGIVKDNGYENIKYNEKEYKVETIFGKINLQSLSLPLISIVMGLVDGFNPCAMWVLLFLITMLFNMNNKRRMWILGLTFIASSAFVYFLFMMAWLKVNDFINTVNALQTIIGLFAIVFGSINLYRYIKEKKSNGCNVIKKEKRKIVFSNIKKIVENKCFIISVIGIIVLAVIVNLIELLCSLGLPVMFTEILSLNKLTNNKYLFYIIIYIFFFMLDDILIFTISMLSLKSKAMSTRYNKYSHLIGGIIMIVIGLLIIFKPDWLAFNFR